MPVRAASSSTVISPSTTASTSVIATERRRLGCIGTQSLAPGDCDSKTETIIRLPDPDRTVIPMTEAFVYDAVRTPRGRGKDTGSLHGTKPVSLVVGLLDEV